MLTIASRCRGNVLHTAAPVLPRWPWVRARCQRCAAWNLLLVQATPAATSADKRRTAGETAQDASGTRSGRVRVFEFDRVRRERNASGTCPRPFVPVRSSSVGNRATSTSSAASTVWQAHQGHPSLGPQCKCGETMNPGSCRAAGNVQELDTVSCTYFRPSTLGQLHKQHIVFLIWKLPMAAHIPCGTDHPIAFFCTFASARCATLTACSNPWPPGEYGCCCVEDVPPATAGDREHGSYRAAAK
eukprot:gene7456-biopygen21048